MIGGLAAGAVLVVSGSTSQAPRAAPLPARPFSAGQDAGPQPEEAKSCPVPVTRSHLVIASLCVDAPIVPASLHGDGTLAIPSDVREVGVWDGGAQLSGPGGRPVEQGTTLITGHVHYPGQGDGALYNLSRVRPDTVIEVSDASGPVTRWRVTSLSAAPKSDLPSWVFAGPTGPRRLVVLTCGGPVVHDPEHGFTYRDNVIATAVPL